MRTSMSGTRCQVLLYEDGFNMEYDLLQITKTWLQVL